MKHTPAPWSFSDFHVWRSHEESMKPNSPCPQIAYIGYGHDDQGNLSEEQEANARLIAAAPELLVALKEALFHLQGYTVTHGHGPSMAKKLQAYKELIAKATGEKEEVC